jgi:uncharacterized RDD family membrane protein YckC
VIKARPGAGSKGYTRAVSWLQDTLAAQNRSLVAFLQSDGLELACTDEELIAWDGQLEQRVQLRDIKRFSREARDLVVLGGAGEVLRSPILTAPRVEIDSFFEALKPAIARARSLKPVARTPAVMPAAIVPEPAPSAFFNLELDAGPTATNVQAVAPASVPVPNSDPVPQANTPAIAPEPAAEFAFDLGPLLSVAPEPAPEPIKVQPVKVQPALEVAAEVPLAKKSVDESDSAWPQAFNLPVDAPVVQPVVVPTATKTPAVAIQSEPMQPSESTRPESTLPESTLPESSTDIPAFAFGPIGTTAQDSQAESVSGKPVVSEPVPAVKPVLPLAAEPANPEPANPEPANPEPARPEPARLEPAPERSQREALRPEPSQPALPNKPSGSAPIGRSNTNASEINAAESNKAQPLEPNPKQPSDPLFDAPKPKREPPPRVQAKDFGNGLFMHEHGFKYQLASIGERFLALLVDSFLMGIVNRVLSAIASNPLNTHIARLEELLRLQATTTDAAQLASFKLEQDTLIRILPGETLQTVLISVTLTLVATWLYFAFFESSQKQGTPGKSLMKIGVTDLNIARISFMQSTRRFAWRYGPFYVTLMIAFVTLGSQMYSGSNGALAAFFSFMIWVVVALLLLIADSLAAAFTKKRQTGHDLLAQTLVVKA